MVAPIIAARVVGGEVAKNSGRKAVAGSQVRTRRRDLAPRKKQTSRYTREQEQDFAQRTGQLTPKEQDLILRMQQLRALQTQVQNAAANEKQKDPDVLVKRIAATQACSVIFWSAIGFYVPQITFWLIGIAGIGLEAIPVVNYVIPGQLLFFVSYAVIFFIGICTMLYSVWILMLRKIDCFSGYKGLIFLLCLDGYMVIFINFIPWFVVWLWSVILLQKK
jgi:hypothetical protein